MAKKTRDKSGRFVSNKASTKKIATNEKRQGSMFGLSRSQLLDVVYNATVSRGTLFREFTDPRRDIDDECGFLKPEQITPEIYKDSYRREPIAKRVVEVLPKESWLATPSVFETEDPDETTPFEKDWSELPKQLDEDSWYETEEGNPIWSYLTRVDILSGIGSYGVLLFGVDDSKELKEPVEPKKGMKLTFLRVFDETLATIAAFETNPANPRFGKPVMYNLTFSDPRNQLLSSTMGENVVTHQVHYTRVLHVADNLESDEVVGTPRQRPVFNHLQNLNKLYHGSAEMYWRAAFPGLSFETHPQAGGDIEIDVEAVKDQIEQYMNTLQRYFTTAGMTVKSLAPQVVDPTPQIDTQIEAICVEKAIPKRIFLGSERGELASSQDMRTWNGRVTFRENRYLSPKVIAPFINRVIWLGIISQPKSFKIIWPDLNSLTELEQATVAVQRTEALSKYVMGGVENLLNPIHFFTIVLGLTNDEATNLLEEVRATDESEMLTIPEVVEEPEDSGVERSKDKET